jgi:hypothetical protein
MQSTAPYARFEKVFLDTVAEASFDCGNLPPCGFYLYFI